MTDSVSSIKNLFCRFYFVSSIKLSILQVLSVSCINKCHLVPQKPEMENVISQVFFLDYIQLVIPCLNCICVNFCLIGILRVQFQSSFSSYLSQDMEGKSHYSLFNFKKKKSQPSFSKLVYIISTRSDVKFLFLKLNFFLVVGKVVVSLQVGKSARGHYNIIDEV